MGCLNAANSHEEINLHNLDGNAPNTLFDSDPDDNQREEIIVGNKLGYLSNNNSISNSHDDLKIDANPGIENKINVLRKEAIDYGAKMKDSYEKSQKEFITGDKALAKKLSDEGNKYKDKMNEKNNEAKAIAFDYKNKLRGLDEIDLHLLLVDEALQYLEEHIKSVKEAKLSHLIVIHGQGNHSDKNIAKIKPSCYKYLDSLGMNYTKDIPNPGCLTINF